MVFINTTCINNKAPRGNFGGAICMCEKCVKDRQNNKLKGRLIKHAATLLKCDLSDNPEDYPAKFPLWVLRDIERHQEKLKLIAIELRKIADEI